MPDHPLLISSPTDPLLAELCIRLGELADQPGREDAWPSESLQLCADYGVFRWFIGEEFQGLAWNPEQITEGYLQLSAACLTTTFVITQRTAASRRIESSSNERIKQALLPDLAAGKTSSTVGISHLTTSRQHVAKPVLRAKQNENGFLIDGFSPWVTGGMHADTIVMGATLPDQQQILFVVNRDQVLASPPHSLMALTGSCTGAVNVQEVQITENDVIGGPASAVLQSATGGMTGGLQTSTLAIGLASAAIDFIRSQATNRIELSETAAEFEDQIQTLRSQLLELAKGNQVISTQDLRTEANSLVLRSTQAALVAAKGAGYVSGHRVGRWCREAMFFLVWSCPQAVLAANLCELAGIEVE